VKKTCPIIIYISLDDITGLEADRSVILQVVLCSDNTLTIDKLSMQKFEL
jgi:hypothetical protein